MVVLAKILFLDTNTCANQSLNMGFYIFVEFLAPTYPM